MLLLDQGQQLPRWRDATEGMHARLSARESCGVPRGLRLIQIGRHLLVRAGISNVGTRLSSCLSVLLLQSCWRTSGFGL